jgi:hypothetical protein
LVRKQWLFTTFDNTWMDIDPNQKDDSEKRGRNKEAGYGSFLFRMNQCGFIIIDEYLLNRDRLQAMNDTFCLIFCKKESPKRMIIHNGGEAAPNNTLQPSLKSGLL